MGSRGQKFSQKCLLLEYTLLHLNDFKREINVVSNMVLYQKIISKIGSSLPPKLQRIWFHPVGPTTIFFWAPAMKWGLVIAGLSDVLRPPETVSVAQTASLAITGAIWSRYSLVIVPKNWVLFSVNVVVFLTNIHNCTRAVVHQMDKKYEMRRL